MNKSVRVVIQCALVTVTLAAACGTAFANDAGTWKKDHPRRAEVNRRLNNQNKRIHQDVKNGTLSKGQAAGLHKEDHQVRQEERDMASQNGGHLTKPEQRTLNSQENAISNQIPPK
jgi:hypothetical protein